MSSSSKFKELYSFHVSMPNFWIFSKKILASVNLSVFCHQSIYFWIEKSQKNPNQHAHHQFPSTFRWHKQKIYATFRDV